MNILITGGAGYIGSILVPELLRAGHEVVVIDSFMYGQATLLDSCHYDSLALIRGDARDKVLMAQHVKKADAIIPLACLTGAPVTDKDPIAARTTTLDAITMLLELRSKSQRILYPTTNSGYGIGEQGIECTEKTPLRPVSLYGRLKCDAENAILAAGNAITFRLATAFGISPRMRLDLLVNDFVYRAVNDGFVVLFEADFKRNYIHVRDIAAAFIHGMDNFEKMKNEAYNVGLSDCSISKRELCVEIRKQVPNFYFPEAPLAEDPDKRDYIVSNAKIEGTGFKPAFPLGRGITELIKGCRSVKRNQYSNV